MKKTDLIDIQISMLIILIMIALISIPLIFLRPRIEPSMTEPITIYFDNLAPQECENLNITPTARCLNKYVKSIYKYTETNDSITLSLEELKEKGGDCKDWSELYAKMGKELGFNVKHQTVINRKTENMTYLHSFATISNEEGYCILDQEHFTCYT